MISPMRGVALAENMDKYKRQSRRSHFGALAQVYDYASKSRIGYLGDISTRGFMLFTNRKFPDDGRRLVVIRLPFPDEPDIVIHAGIRISWQQQDEHNPKQYCIGCKIVALSPNDRLELLKAAKIFGISS